VHDHATVLLERAVRGLCRIACLPFRDPAQAPDRPSTTRFPFQRTHEIEFIAALVRLSLIP